MTKKFNGRSFLAPISLILLLAASISNVYLTDLHVRVKRSGNADTDSFCNISKEVHCSRVAASSYASFQGVPMALFAAEYFGLVSLGVALTLLGLWPIKRWESLLFWMMLLALPVCALMAYIAKFKLRILCPMCTLTYSVNALLLTVLLIANCRKLRELVCDGPKEIASMLSRRWLQVSFLLLISIGLSQFLWVPELIGAANSGKPQVPPEGGEAHVPEGGMSVGSNAAPIQLVSFSDYQCSVCRRGHEMVVELLRRHGDKIHFTHRDFPLDNKCNRMVNRKFHSYACEAAYFARCASEQQRYWPFIALLFSHQRELNTKQLESFARQTGLDVDKLNSCVRKPETRRAVLNDIEAGIRQHVTGTPTFFLNGERIVGPKSIAWWEEHLQRKLPFSRPNP